MSTRSLDAAKRAGARMAGDIETIIDDGEELLRAAAEVSEDGFQAARSHFEHKLASARAGLTDTSRRVVDGTRNAAHAADGYVHGHAWGAVGVALAAGVLIGFLTSKGR